MEHVKSVKVVTENTNKCIGVWEFERELQDEINKMNESFDKVEVLYSDHTAVVLGGN